MKVIKSCGLSVYIQTDHVIEAMIPDLVVVDKRRTCKIIDIAFPGEFSSIV